jgi:hypothetical protein
MLEDRLVPATFTVTTPLDVVNANDGKLSLREAISQANAHAGSDTIVVPRGLYKIALPGTDDNANRNGDFDVTGPVTIRGGRRGRDRRRCPASGPRLRRLRHPSFLDQGHAPGPDRPQWPRRRRGRGGIRVGNADLVLQDCVVIGNRTLGNGGGISNAALPGTGNVTLVRSIIESNVAVFGGGLRVRANGQGQGSVLNVSGSTIKRNTAQNGGGISASKVNLLAQRTTAPGTDWR